MSRPRSSSSSTRCPRSASWWRSTGAARPHGHAGRRRILDPRLRGRPRPAARRLFPDRPIDLLGHSMGGNVVVSMPGCAPRASDVSSTSRASAAAHRPEQAPRRFVEWLDDLKVKHELRRYPSLAAVAARLRKRSLLPTDRAAWLAQHWPRARPAAADSRVKYEILGDPAHKRPTRCCTAWTRRFECWKLITAPLLWSRAIAPTSGAGGASATPRKNSTSACRWWRAWSAVCSRRPATCCSTIAPKRWQPGSRTSSRLRDAAPRSPAARAGG